MGTGVNTSVSSYHTQAYIGVAECRDNGVGMRYDIVGHTIDSTCWDVKNYSHYYG